MHYTATSHATKTSIQSPTEGYFSCSMITSDCCLLPITQLNIMSKEATFFNPKMMLFLAPTATRGPSWTGFTNFEADPTCHRTCKLTFFAPVWIEI